MSAEDLARRFHQIYERLAPEYGYKTRDESAVAWEDVPDKNKTLMIATCKALLQEVHLIDLSDYALQEPEKSHCPHCEKLVHLLAPRMEHIQRPITLPFFFLCSHCGAILESGIGSVAGPEER